MRGTSGERVGLPLISGDGRPVVTGAVEFIPGLRFAKSTN